MSSAMWGRCKYWCWRLAVLRCKMEMKSHRKKLADKLQMARQKDVINVLFMVENVAMWKNESLYQLMCVHPQFEPALCIAYDAGEHDMERRIEKRRATEIHFKQQGHRVLRASTLETARNEFEVDIVFDMQPYCSIKEALFDAKLRELHCYAPYGFHSSTIRQIYDSVCRNRFLYHFVENETVCKVAAPFMLDGGANIKVTGIPFSDVFLSMPAAANPWKNANTGRKRVIWAPHWSVNTWQTWFQASSFVQLADIMLEVAKKYEDVIQFAFKPHPYLLKALSDHPEWGKERAEMYYRRWDELPNAQVEMGAYVDLFKYSDAIIHDSGSFIIEYLYVDKPAMYLKSSTNAIQTSEIGEEALECYVRGITQSDIEAFIEETVIKGKDACQQKRRAFREKYLLPPHGCSAAQNIINALLIDEYVP